MKKWYQSRTMWVNILTSVGAVVLLATQTFELSPEVLTWFVFGQGVINIGLRAVTGEPLTLK